jgi:hypothetical protein
VVGRRKLYPGGGSSIEGSGISNIGVCDVYIQNSKRKNMQIKYGCNITILVG